MGVIDDLIGVGLSKLLPGDRGSICIWEGQVIGLGDPINGAIGSRDLNGTHLSRQPLDTEAGDGKLSVLRRDCGEVSREVESTTEQPRVRWRSVGWLLPSNSILAFTGACCKIRDNGPSTVELLGEALDIGKFEGPLDYSLNLTGHLIASPASGSSVDSLPRSGGSLSPLVGRWPRIRL